MDEPRHAGGRPRRFTETDVIAAATEQFSRFGYGHTSVDDLQAVTNLGRASLYRTFGDKHQLFLRAFTEYCDASVARIAALLTEGDGQSAAQRLTRYVTTTVDDIAADTERRGCFVAKGTAELAATDPQVAAQTQRTYEATLRLLADCVAAGQREGDLRPDVDPMAAAATVFAATRGAEALGKGGVGAEILQSVAEQTIRNLSVH